MSETDLVMVEEYKDSGQTRGPGGEELDTLEQKKAFLHAIAFKISDIDATSKRRREDETRLTEETYYISTDKKQAGEDAIMRAGRVLQKWFPGLTVEGLVEPQWAVFNEHQTQILKNVLVTSSALNKQKDAERKAAIRDEAEREIESAALYKQAKERMAYETSVRAMQDPDEPAGPPPSVWGGRPRGGALKRLKRRKSSKRKSVRRKSSKRKSVRRKLTKRKTNRRKSIKKKSKRSSRRMR